MVLIWSKVEATGASWSIERPWTKISKTNRTGLIQMNRTGSVTGINRGEAGFPSFLPLPSLSTSSLSLNSLKPSAIPMRFSVEFRRVHTNRRGTQFLARRPTVIDCGAAAGNTKTNPFSYFFAFLKLLSLLSLNFTPEFHKNKISSLDLKVKREKKTTLSCFERIRPRIGYGHCDSTWFWLSFRILVSLLLSTSFFWFLFQIWVRFDDWESSGSILCCRFLVVWDLCCCVNWFAFLWLLCCVDWALCCCQFRVGKDLPSLRVFLYVRFCHCIYSGRVRVLKEENLGRLWRIFPDWDEKRGNVFICLLGFWRVPDRITWIWTWQTVFFEFGLKKDKTKN